MKENKYDDNVFFEKYSRMSRSREGLKGAGEWETGSGLWLWLARDIRRGKGGAAGDRHRYFGENAGTGPKY